MTVWIQMTPDVLSGQIWIETVYRGHQQTTMTSGKRVNDYRKIRLQMTNTDVKSCIIAKCSIGI